MAYAESMDLNSVNVPVGKEAEYSRGQLLGSFWRIQRIRGSGFPGDDDLEASLKTAPPLVRKFIQDATKREPYAKEPRARFAPDDIQRYRAKRERMSTMKGSEGVAWAEYMLLEGAASERSLSKGKYSWFSENGGEGSVLVRAYAPSKIDDFNSGTDAILMFTDDEAGLAAYPMSVDVVTFDERVQEKLVMSNRRLREEGGTPVYWYDIYSQEDADEVSRDAKGRVRSTNVAVYLPKNLCEVYDNPRNPKDKSDRVMQDLGPFVRLQMEIQIRQQFANLLSSNYRGGLTKETLEMAVKEELSRIERKNEQDRTPKDIALDRMGHQLICLWKVAESNGFRLTPELKKALPLEFVRELQAMPDLARHVL